MLYTVETQTQYNEVYEVEANSVEEAKAKVIANEGTMTDQDKLLVVPIQVVESDGSD